MSAPVYLVPTEKASGWVDGALVDLDGPEARHAVTVRRTAAGEIIVLSDGAGRWARGPVRSVGRDQLTIEVAEHGEDPIPAVRFVLVQALAKGDRDERAVETATGRAVAFGPSVGAATCDTGHQHSTSEARRLACNAGLLPVVLGGASVPLDLGRQERFYSEAQRTALAALLRGV